MDYLSFSFTLHPVQPYSEILVAKLSTMGFDMFEDTNNGVVAYITTNHHIAEIDKEINGLLKELNSEISFEKKIIKAENWNALWESNFEPVLIGNECYIRATFHPPHPQVKYEIVIDPKMSFGTGHHQTTSLVIREMLKINFVGKNVLDMGCGTAVLAILAAKAGAKNITAIDIDEWAYTNSIENIERNNTPKIQVHKGNVDLLDGMHYDVILANINKNIILRDISRYNKALNNEGSLILSGFLDVDANDILDAAAALGLQKKISSTENNWTVITLSK